MTKHKVIWTPLAGSQTQALTCPCNEILYDGTRGPGKTDAQIMKFRMNVGKGYGAHWRGIILDKHFGNLSDIVKKAERWLPFIGQKPRFLASQASYKWVWPTGEELLFRPFEKKSDYVDRFHGHEYQFIGWNELSTYPTSDCYDVMMSTNRTSFVPELHTPKDKDGRYKTHDGKPLPEIPLTVFSTTNPHGVGHNWVKRRFIDVAPAGKVVRNKTEVFNPRTQKDEIVVKTQVRIFGSYRENIYLTPEYIATLVNEKDPNRREAWLNGNWDVTSGGALDDLWKSTVHIVPRFKIPKGWRITRSFDWGSTHPYSVGWWAISNGEEVEHEGRKLWFPPKSLIRIHELYGSAAIGEKKERFGHNQGTKEGPKAISVKILSIEKALMDNGWIHTKPRPGPADTQIYSKNDTETETIGKRMADAGVTWTRANKAPGTRKNGLVLIRERLECAQANEGPGLYIMQHNDAFIETVPTIPRDENDPDDVDTDAEDHVYDEARYMCLDSRPEYVGKMDITWPT